MNHDPIVEEVRAVRERLAAKFDFDIRRIIADARSRQALHGSRVVSLQKASPRARHPERDGDITGASSQPLALNSKTNSGGEQLA